MRVCDIKDCNKKHFGKGYCQSHYMKLKFRWYSKAISLGTYKKVGICKIKECKRGHYAKGYCRKHYAILIRTGNPFPTNISNKNKICKAEKCNNFAHLKELCFSHYGKLRNHGDIYYKREYSTKSQYYKHSIMKEQRLKKIKLTKGKCEMCSKKGKEIHHLDLSNNNHSLKNLLFLCIICHRYVHKILRKIPKLIHRQKINKILFANIKRSPNDKIKIHKKTRQSIRKNTRQPEYQRD